MDKQIARTDIQKRHGKPFDYFRLGKSVAEGLVFMTHMKEAALCLWSEAEKENAFNPVKQCPVCSAQNFKILFEFLKFPYAQCSNTECEHVFISHPVKDDFRWNFFAKDSVYSKKNYCDPETTKFRIEQIATPKVEHVLAYTGDLPGKSWLDVGCGSGEILSVLKQKDWNAIGLELSREDCQFGNEVLKVDVRNQTLEDFADSYQGESLDVISFFGILHCVRNPGELVQKAVQLLKPGGLLIAEIPHFNSMVTASVMSFPNHPTRSSYNGVTTLHMFTQRSIQKIFQTYDLFPLSVWFLGADIFEILNQWALNDSSFIKSPLYQKLLVLSNKLQGEIDRAELSEAMIWIARKT